MVSFIASSNVGRSDAQRAQSPLYAGLSGLACLALALLQACSSPISNPAPVVDHSVSKPAPREIKPEVSARTPAVVTPESTVKPGYYTVKPGDTIYHISLDNGQNWKDLARWNNLENPNVIDVGKVLRVVPPESGVATEGVVVRPVNSQNNPTVSTGTMTSVGTTGGAQSTAPPSVVPAPAPAQPPPTPAATAQTPPLSPPAQTSPGPSADSAGENPTFIWPSSGKVVATFDEVKNKGVDISGKLGDPVVAAADGKVVYSGSGLRGYGNLLIIKHNNTYLTAYAHNQAILVKEDQAVKQGQKIAEVGSSDADQPGLHFEIRKYGKPIDPLKWLPAR